MDPGGLDMTGKVRVLHLPACSWSKYGLGLPGSCMK
jgi:hypothetical protein